ncbi:hypothetical protein D0T49_07445 [Paludibacter sp. 221]|uniref:hypothetical protein n=1 Tax=Paludibacter sp. 221 TaxID=2302939 RepID=UPI0013D1A0BA|nr:hypothetical protein [Paludibacter sp. 221]NDV46880.1 hypothetical protein [Paludibacter sp. 221]
MKNELLTIFRDKIEHQGIYSDEIHIVDYTERTKSKRAVVAHCVKPVDIDSLKILNPTKIHLTTSIFKPQCFIDADGKELKQCECVIYPTSYVNNYWILFVEIKDCKPKNLSRFSQDVKDKFIANVTIFRDKGIISKNKIVYAIASFPRRNKTDFHSHFIKISEVKKFLDSHNIIIKGTNKITIQDKQIILL